MKTSIFEKLMFWNKTIRSTKQLGKNAHLFSTEENGEIRFYMKFTYPGNTQIHGISLKELELAIKECQFQTNEFLEDKE